MEPGIFYTVQCDDGIDKWSETHFHFKTVKGAQVDTIKTVIASVQTIFLK